MSRTVFGVFRAALLACAGFSATLAAETLVGLRASDLHLISFDSATPGTLTGDLTLTGFPTGVSPVALDFRPATQTLYTVGRGPVSTNCRLYTINPDDGVVTAQSGTFACPADFSDIDFNPSTDRLRVISTSETFKVDPANGTKDPDEDPAFTTGDANFGDTPMIGGSGHDQNTASSPTTTLFAIEAGNDVLVRVGSVNGSPDAPENGKLTTVGDLNLDVDADTVFDISGTSPGTAYLFSFTPVATFEGNLYTVNLTSGETTLVGSVGAGGVNLVGLTAAPGFTLGSSSTDDEQVLFGALSPLLLLVLAVLGMVRIARRRAAR